MFILLHLRCIKVAAIPPSVKTLPGAAIRHFIEDFGQRVWTRSRDGGATVNTTPLQPSSVLAFQDTMIVGADGQAGNLGTVFQHGCTAFEQARR